jgi:hypothetical protein
MGTQALAGNAVQPAMQSLPTALAEANAPPVFDPRYNNILFNFAYRNFGGIPGSREMTLNVRNGEGEVWLDPSVTPVAGTITDGTLVMASESFPRYAPLSMTITGADLCFHVRQGRLLSFAFVRRGDILMRLLCTNFLRAAYRYEVQRSGNTQLILSRYNQADGDRATHLEMNVTKGAAPEPIGGMIGGGRIDQQTGKVLVDKLLVRRAADGELKLQFHGARFEWQFAGGALRAVGVYDSRGKIGIFSVLPQAGAGVAVTAAFSDTLG